MHVMLNGFQQTVRPCLGYRWCSPFGDRCSALQLLGQRSPAGLSKEELGREGRDFQTLHSELVFATT